MKTIFDDISLNYYRDVISNAGGYESTLDKIRWSMHGAGNAIMAKIEPAIKERYIEKTFKPTEIFKANTQVEAIYQDSVIHDLTGRQPALEMLVLQLMPQIERKIKDKFIVDMAHTMAHVVSFLKHRPEHEILGISVVEPTLYGMSSWDLGVRDTFFKYDLNGVPGSNAFKKLYEKGRIEMNTTGYSYKDVTELMLSYGVSYSDHFKVPTLELPEQSEMIEAYAAAKYGRFKFENNADNQKNVKLSEVSVLDLLDVKGKNILLQERDVEAVQALVNPKSVGEEKMRLLLTRPGNKMVLSSVEAMKQSLLEKSYIAL